MNQSPTCRGPVRISRRQVLQAGTIGLWGLTLPRLLRAESQRSLAGLAAKADACILVFLNGGPSHLDMWDMKPAAPAEIRGEFKPIATSVPGVQFSEHLPRLAKQMHHASIVRSVHHSVNNSHAAAVYAGLTGHDRGEDGGGAKPTDYPAIGSVLGTLPAAPGAGCAVRVHALHHGGGTGGPPQPGFFGGWLGRGAIRSLCSATPMPPNFGMPELSPAPGMTGGVPAGTPAARWLSGKCGRADWTRPSAIPRHRHLSGQGIRFADFSRRHSGPSSWTGSRQPVRERYGRNIYGQSVLLARRLIEGRQRVLRASPGRRTPTPLGTRTAAISRGSRMSCCRSSMRPCRAC